MYVFSFLPVNEVVSCTDTDRLVFVCVGGQEGEALEAATKQFEDLEFQQLEKESSLEEERETVSQQLLHQRAEYHRSVARRKVGETCVVVTTLQPDG